MDSKLNDSPKNIFDANKIRWYNTFEVSQYFRFMIALNWMREIFLKDTSKRRRTVADFGCSYSQLYNFWRNNCNFYFWPHLNYYGVEADKERMNFGKERIVKKRNDRLEYFFQDLSKKFILPKKCDVIVCMEVLEHLVPEKASILLENIYNNLKKSGYTIMSSPNPDKENGENFVWEEPHNYEYSFKEAKKLVKENGFKVIRKCGILPRRTFYKQSKNSELYQKLKKYYSPSVVANILCPISEIKYCKQWMMLLKKRKV